MQVIMRLAIMVLLITAASCHDVERDDCVTPAEYTDDKIKGGSILQLWILEQKSKDRIEMAQKTNADWASLSPYISITKRQTFRVEDELEKLRMVIPKIVRSDLTHLLLKPLTSFKEIDGSIFWGEFEVCTEAEWIKVESAYEELIYGFAGLSEEFPEVKMLSIGNELKQFTKHRPDFFKHLIDTIRQDFPSLSLTYAANWDEYNHIEFWNRLDFIGINSYFPLVNKKTASVKEVEQALVCLKQDLSTLSCMYDRPVLFTEYGFRSIDKGTWKSWKLGPINYKNINNQAQVNGYKAFYNTYWDEPWVAGGFFWEWGIPLQSDVYGSDNNGWYVNEKPVEEVIYLQYSE